MTKQMRFLGVSPFFKQQNNNLSHITSQPKYIVTNVIYSVLCTLVKMGSCIQ